MPIKHLKFRNLIAIVFAFAGLSVTALAQGTKCLPPASALTGLTLEQVLDFNNNVLATAGPPAPPGVLNGTQEIHQRFVLNPGNATISAFTFLVPKGSPARTDLGTVTAANTLQVATILVDQIQTGSTPELSLMIIGTLINSPPGGFPSSVGTPVILTMGYVSLGFANWNQINDFALVVAGQVVSWSPTATGILSLGYPPHGTVTEYCGGA